MKLIRKMYLCVNFKKVLFLSLYVFSVMSMSLYVFAEVPVVSDPSEATYIGDLRQEENNADENIGIYKYNPFEEIISSEVDGAVIN